MTHALPFSLYSLLYQIVDYAGLFPPASLALEPAIRNFIRYQTWPEHWMLSRFIIPAVKLRELAELVMTGLTWDGTLRFSVLGRSGMDPEAFLTGVEADIQEVKDFRRLMGERFQLDVYETRIPVAEEEQHVRAILDKAIPIFYNAGLSSFFESPFSQGWEFRAEDLIQVIAHANATTPSDLHVGFKLRTGGVTADAFPTPAQVAFALCSCRDTGVSIKCTAGLHHPIRSFRTEVGTNMHGFLNVFIGGVMASAHGLDVNRVGKILEEENPAQFEFSSDELVWNGLKVETAHIEKIRRLGLISFGSCSFEEPKEDLEALGFHLIKS